MFVSVEITGDPVAGLAGASPAVTVTANENVVADSQVMTFAPLYSGCDAPAMVTVCPFSKPCGDETHVAVAVVPDRVMVTLIGGALTVVAGVMPVMIFTPL